MSVDGLLTALWPEDQAGLRCVAALCQGSRGTYWKNWFVDTTEKARHLITKADQRTDVVGVYHACALYDPGLVAAAQAADKAEKARDWSWAGRTATNAASACALWMDVDVKPDKPGAYPTPADAQAAIKQFAGVFLPPSFVVASGGGFHLYWVLDTPIGSARWEALATRAKALAKQHGFLADPTRTADLASVLRPPGTLNRKNDPAVEVRCRDLGYRYTEHDIEQALGEVQAELPPAPAHIQRADNSDLTDSLYSPSKVRGVIHGCQQIQTSVLRRGAGDPEPLWRDVLRTLARCEDAPDALLHKISSGHADYSPAETDKKIAHVRTMAPATCVSFEASNPGGCAGCPHAGREGFSPIRLGEEKFTQAPPPAPQSPLSQYVLQDHGQPDFKFDILQTGGAPLLRYQDKVKDADGNMVWSGTWTPLCSTLYRIERIERTFGTGEHEAIYRFLEPSGREFEARAPTSIVNDAKATFEFLGRVGIVALTHEKQKRMAHQSYNKQWLEKLKQQPTPVSYRHFGWTADVDGSVSSFIGAYQYHMNGTATLVNLSGSAQQFSRTVRVAGTLDRWREIAKVFCRRGLEPQQFCMMLGLFTPFVTLSPPEPPGFAAVCLISTMGGQGKTTAARLATSAWMDPSVQLGQADTQNARLETLSLLNNLPCLFDEMTTATPENVVDLVYAIGNGAPRQKLDSNAVLKPLQRFRLPAFLTSNASIRDKLYEARQSQDQASNARVIQIYLNKDVALEQELVQTRLLHDLPTNFGSAGDWWARYLLGIMDGRSRIEDFVHEYGVVKDGLAAVSNDANNLRTVIATLAAAIVGARWCARARFLPIDAEAFERWVIDTLLPDQAEQMKEIEQDKLQMLGEFLHANMHFVVESTVLRPMKAVTSNGVTAMSRTSERVEVASVTPDPSAFHARTVVARWETFLNRLPNSPQTHVAETRLLVARSALRAFLAERKCDLSGFVRDAEAIGLLIPYRGTDNMTSIKKTSRPLYPLGKKYQANAALIDVLVFDPTKHPALSVSAAEVLERVEIAKADVEGDLADEATGTDS